MDLKPFRTFRPEDAYRLAKTLEEFEVKVYRKVCNDGCVCVTPESIRPSYIIVEGTGKVSIHDPLRSHPSTPHRTLLGQVDPLRKAWASEVRSLYLQRSAPAPKSALAPTPVLKSSTETWVPAVGLTGPIPGLEVTEQGGFRLTDGSVCRFDRTRPSRLHLGKRHTSVYLPEVILCTFGKLPPGPGWRATRLKNSEQIWALSNLAWVDRQPTRFRMESKTIKAVFKAWGEGKLTTEIGAMLHLGQTTVSATLRGLRHPEYDKLRRDTLKLRDSKGIPDDKMAKHLRKNLS